MDQPRRPLCVAREVPHPCPRGRHDRVPKRDPHERRPRAPDWEPEAAAAEIAELAAASDDAAGGDIAA